MSHSQLVRPPKWPLRLLRIFAKKEYLEEIEGDLEEIFFDNVESLSPAKARRIYAIETIRLFRPILIRKLNFLERLNHYPMFQNYFKVSLRGLMKNPVNSFINVFGLAVAIGLFVFAYGFARWTFRTDQFHVHKNEVHLVTFFADRDGTLEQHGRTPRPLGEMLKEDFTHIKNVCRVDDRNVVMKREDNVFHERVRFVDPSFLEMFTFPLKWGTASSLKDINSIILSEQMSEKYFGDENPIGQSMLMIFGKDHSKQFKVAGVAKEFPKSRTISFNFLINFDNLKTADSTFDHHDWKQMVNATFIQVDDQKSLATIKDGMSKYKDLQNKAADEDWAIKSFGFEPLATLHERSEYIRDGISRSSRSNYISIMFMAGIAIFMLVLACFNYINIAIVSAAKRFKEIGVRKSIGATRRVMIIQFLAENVVVTSFAMVTGVLLGYFFFISGFEQLWNFDMDFTLKDPNLWLFLPLILIITSIASGIYPALYISKFQVVNILKGSVMFGRKNPATKIFLGMQLIIACVFITTSVMFTQNTMYLHNRGWGYNQKQSLYATVENESAFEKLSAKLSQHPDILAISGSVHHVGKSHATTIVHFPDREYEVDHLAVSPNYFETIGLTLKEGRQFKDHEGSDRQSVIVNELFVSKMAWETAIGQQFRIDSVKYEVIGVLKDFHNYSFDSDIRPLIFTVAPKSQYRYITLKIAKDSELRAYAGFRDSWIELFPEIPFTGAHQEDVWGRYYNNLNIYSLVWKVFATLAITLATLGLYGLIRLNVAGRTKEFSIRKVLGAGLKNIAMSVTSEFVLLMALAIGVGAPAGYLFGKWIIEFAHTYHMPITFSGVTMAVMLMIVVLFGTVSTQIFKVFKANPVEGLKVE